eukprot:TCONS_00042394-protein
MEIAFLGAAKMKIESPDKSRITEALYIHLCQTYQDPKQKTDDKKFRSRWTSILSDYSKIRACVLNSQYLVNNTRMQLPIINEKSLSFWYKDREPQDITTLLLQGQDEAPVTRRFASEPLPPPRAVPSNLQGNAPKLVVKNPKDRSGQAAVRKRQANRIRIPK